MTKPKAKQKDLPGVEKEITELQSKGMEYAAIRDERQALLQQEVVLKEELRALMKKHKKTKYSHKDVTIELVPEGEKVKVRIAKSKDDED
jgi:hypothetical protein